MDRLEAALSENVRKTVRMILNLLLIAAIALLVSQEVKAIIVWHFSREAVQENQALFALPRPLLDLSLPQVRETTTMTLSGCSLDVPWTGGKQKTPELIYFPNGSGILFFDPAKEPDAAALYRQADNRSAMTHILGAATIRSNYDLTAAEVNANPADVTLLTTLPKIARLDMLLTFKAGFVSDQTGPVIYAVAMNRVHGFQAGDPKLHPKRVGLEMFDPKDRPFHVLIFPAKDAAQPVTQPEINSMIHSMRCDDAVH